MPKISVIIPNYNHVQYLKQRIDSVLNQTYKDFELIILDDCSSDNSREVIEQYNGHPLVTQIIYNEVNSGSPFKQWVKGIQIATGEFIWIAESDDWAEITFLEDLMLYYDKIPGVSFLYSNTKIVFEDKIELMEPKVFDDYKFFAEHQLLKERLIYGLDIYNGSAVLFRKKAALSHLPKLQQYEKHGDYFLWIKIAEKSTALYLNKPLNNFRVLTTSVTRQSFKDNKSLEEQLSIFHILNNKLSILTIKQKMFFYNCWAFKFSIQQKKTKNVSNTLLRNSCVGKLRFYSVYFWLKFAYYYLHCPS